MTMLAAGGGLLPQHITMLFLALALLLGLARVLGELSRRFGQPAILGEIFAGVVLGPTILGRLNPRMFEALFPTAQSAQWGSTGIAEQSLFIISAAMLLFVAGLEVDLSAVWRQGLTTVRVSAMGIVIPFACGFTAAWFLPVFLLGGEEPKHHLAFALFFGISLSITALPIIAKILMDLNILKSDIGMLILSSAMLNDLLGWMGVAVVLAIASSGDAAAGAAAANGDSVVMTMVWTVGFIVAMLTAGRLVCHKVLPYIQARWSWPSGVIGISMVVALACSAFTEWIGIHSIFGAFIAGVTIGDSHHLRGRTRETIHEFITSIFAPLFFASIALHVDFIADFRVGIVVLVLVIALIGKVLGCYWGARLSRMAKRPSLAVGFGMAAQGTMGIILGDVALRQELITNETFVAIVIMALVTSLISGPAIARLLESKQKRSLGDLLTERQFVDGMRSHDVQAALGELSARAADLAEPEAGDIFKAVWSREQIMHTGMPGGLAIPHARIAGLKKPMVIIGRSSDGIDFDASDGKDAHIICMLLTPMEDTGAQIDILRMIAEAFSDPHSIDHAMHAANFTEFLAALKLPGDAREESDPSAAGAAEDMPERTPGPADKA